MLYSFESICECVEKLKRKYGESDPFKLCKLMGINVLLYPMGNGSEACKGFFLYQSRIKSITINSDLSPVFQKIIVAHELGHSCLHSKKTGISAFHEFALFDAASIMEYEANIFAAEILLDDSEVLESLNCDQSFFQAAASLNVPAEILDFKFRTLKWKGYKVSDAPVFSSNTWLRKAEDGGSFED